MAGVIRATNGDSRMNPFNWNLSVIFSDNTTITAIHIIIKDPLNFAEHAVATDVSWIITIEDMSQYTIKMQKMT